MERYKAVVESGSHSRDNRYWEERRDCGHLHKSIAAAEACGKSHYGARYVNGSFRANADWHGYRIHNQHGERVEWPRRDRAAHGSRFSGRGPLMASAKTATRTAGSIEALLPLLDDAWYESVEGSYCDVATWGPETETVGDMISSSCAEGDIVSWDTRAADVADHIYLRRTWNH